MDADFIIPAKSASTRVHNKNWRPFAGDDCLVDLVIRKLLLAGVDASRIHVSCDTDICLPVCERWGVQWLRRDPELCDNDVPLTKWMRSICDQVPGESDIAWCQVCDPLFDEYAEALERWKILSTHCDSLVVAYPWRGYLMTEKMQPIGWSFGEHHTPSQKLPQHFLMPFTLSILTRDAIAATGYHVGRNPYWYVPVSPHIDIDTEFDFAVAQAMHSLMAEITPKKSELI